MKNDIPTRLAGDELLPERSPRDRKVRLGLPSYDGTVSCHTFQSMIESLQLFNGGINTLAGFPINCARNILATRFLQSDCTDLLFIDWDMGWTARQAAQIILRDEGVVGAFYAKKMHGDAAWVVKFSKDPAEQEEKDDGLIRATGLGGGMLKIRREVLEGIIATQGDEIRYTTETSEEEFYDFFSMGVVNGEYLSEDYGFCRRAMLAGFGVWAHRGVILPHYAGNVPFPAPEREGIGNLPLPKL